MKKTPLLRTALATLCCAVLSPPASVLAITFTLHADVNMSNVGWSLPAGSSLDWLIDWELQASASTFDSVTGFFTDSQSAFGQPASVAASASGGFSFASAQASIDGTGKPVGLQAALDLTFAPGVDFASGFSTAMGYREFMISGGSGAVNVAFSYDYLAHLSGDAPGWSADYRALLSISDGITTYDLQADDLRSTPVNAAFGDSLLLPLVLQYDTPYSITLSVDPDGNPPEPEPTPDSGPGMLGTALVVLSLCVFHAGRRKAGPRRSIPASRAPTVADS